MQAASIWQLLVAAAIMAALVWLVRKGTRKSKGDVQPGVMGPSGIGGWLTLVAIGTVLSPIRTLSVLANELDGYTKLKAAYSIPNIETAETVEFVLILALVMFQVLVAIMFFQKKRYFPFWYFWQWVATLCVSLAVIVLPPVIVGAPWQAGFTPEALGPLIAVLLVGAIWVTYVFRSVRVRNTFVK
jgi:hypothetical protein